MNYVSRTIAIPIWYDAQRIYVPTVDIPMGEWVLLLTLTPIDNDPLLLEGKHVLTDLEIESNEKLEVQASRSLGDHRWQIFFDNKMTEGDSPQALSYTISITGLDQGEAKTRRFDPMVVAQPDPIYP